MREPNVAGNFEWRTPLVGILRRPGRRALPRLRSGSLRVLCLATCLLFSACGRAPQTAVELKARLPRQFRGEIRLPGEMQPRRIIVEPHDVGVRTEHLLEFNSVRYQILAGREVVAEGDADIHGTISAPDLEIHIERVAGAGEAMRADTFTGHLAADLQSGEAEWTNESGERVKLEMKAAVP